MERNIHPNEAYQVAKGQSVIDAAIDAKRYVTTAMQNHQKIGKGMPPLNHFIELEQLGGLPVEIIRS